MTKLERKQKELLEMMSFSLNSVYDLVGSQNRGMQPRRKLEIFYETLAKLDREALWSSQKEEYIGNWIRKAGRKTR